MIDEKTAYNELILTRLRTKWGVSVEDIRLINPSYIDHFMEESKTFISSGDIVITGGVYCLSLKGRLIADYITGKIFL